jgi:hypothetical protein
MPSLRTLFGGSRPRTAEALPAPQPFPRTDALLEMSSALVFGLKVRAQEMGLAEHAQRVAELADRLAANHGVSDALRAELRQAALLHEVWMIGVPRELLHKGEPLTAEEMARVHAQAEFGAQVALATAGHLAATIIRHQYDDEATLRHTLGEGSDAYLLTLFLRAADVADGISRTRPADGDGAPEQGIHLRRPEGMPKTSREPAEAYAATLAA